MPSNPPQPVTGDEWKNRLPNTVWTDLQAVQNRVQILEHITDGEIEP